MRSPSLTLPFSLVQHPCAGENAEERNEVAQVGSKKEQKENRMAGEWLQVLYQVILGETLFQCYWFHAQNKKSRPGS